MTTNADVGLLSRTDLRGFDDGMIELIFDMQAENWRGRVSNRKHAIMYAPDGSTTLAVSRSANRRRASLNARAAFDRWLRARDAAAEESGDSEKAAASVMTPFGPIRATAQGMVGRALRDESLGDKVWAEMLNQGNLRDYVIAHGIDRDVDSWLGITLTTSGRWVLSDTERHIVIDHSTSLAPEDAHRMMEHHIEQGPAQPSVLGEEEVERVLEVTDMTVVESPPAAEPEGAMWLGTYVCPKCGKTFDKPTGLSTHDLVVHQKTPCEICGREVGPNNMPRHLRMHADREAVMGDPLKRMKPGAAAPPAVSATAAPAAPATPKPVETPVTGVMDVAEAFVQIQRIAVGPVLDELAGAREKIASLTTDLEQMTKRAEDAETLLEMLKETLGMAVRTE